MRDLLRRRLERSTTPVTRVRGARVGVPRYAAVVASRKLSHRQIPPRVRVFSTRNAFGPGFRDSVVPPNHRTSRVARDRSRKSLQFPEASKRSAFRYPSAFGHATTRRTKSPYRPSSRSPATIERLTPTHTARVVHNLSARRDPFVRLGKMMSLASTAASVPVTRASGARPRAQRNAGNGPAPKVREAVIGRRPASVLAGARAYRLGGVPSTEPPTASPGRYPVDREFRDASIVTSTNAVPRKPDA